MPRTRSLNGIAALSAGALATASLTTPATAADAAGDEPGAPMIGDEVPEEALQEWEAERGIDLPDDLFLKIESVNGGSVPESALAKYEYRPPTDTSEASLIKYDVAPGDDRSGDPFLKVTYAPGDVEGEATLGSFEDLFQKTGDIDRESPTDDAFLKERWSYAPGDEPTEDAFIKFDLQADDLAASDAIVAWEYDALDLIEDALVRMGDVSIEGDPDQPIISVLEEVRALGGSPARINPFVDRDRSMKALPLPKNLPADAGTYTTPTAGIWRSVNLPGTVKCGGQTQRIARTVSNRVLIELQDDGQRIRGQGLGERGSKVVLDADPEITGRYVGTVEMTAQGGRVEMDLTAQLITDKRIVGSAAITVKAAGQRCKISRGFDMTYKGE